MKKFAAYTLETQVKLALRHCCHVPTEERIPSRIMISGQFLFWQLVTSFRKHLQEISFSLSFRCKNDLVISIDMTHLQNLYFAFGDFAKLGR